MRLPLRLLILGAHPDDAEFHAGGLAARYTQAGHIVRMVSATDGAAGHHQCWGAALAQRRRAEARAAAGRLGAESEVWEFPDGALEPDLVLRERVIEEIRRFQPDLLLTHRPCDYHPDHRALGQAVQDACYLVTVPAVAVGAPALRSEPVVAYLPDLFTRPAPLTADVVLDVTPQHGTLVELLDCHASQVYEWLPYQMGRTEQVPGDADARRLWLGRWVDDIWGRRAERFRATLVAHYGAPRGEMVRLAEAFEISEYAAPLDDVARERLFGWLD